MFIILLIVSVSYLTVAQDETTTEPIIAEPTTILLDIPTTLMPSVHSLQKDIECGTEANRHIGTFTIYDYSVVIGMLVISLGIGVFYGFFDSSSENTSSDFLHGTEMSLLPVALSLTTSFITAIELLGNPSEITFYGTQFSLIVISMIMVIPVALKVFYPIYFKLQLTSCYEYLGIRFGNNIRIFGAILYIIQVSFLWSMFALQGLYKFCFLRNFSADVILHSRFCLRTSHCSIESNRIEHTTRCILDLPSLHILFVAGRHESSRYR